MAEYTWLKLGDKLNKGDIVLSRCKRFAIGFIGNDKFGVFIARDRDKNVKREVHAFHIGKPVNPAMSKIYANITPTGFEVIDYLGPGPYTLNIWSRYPEGADSSCVLTVSPQGSFQIMKNFDFWASPPPTIEGTPLFSTPDASILQILEIRDFGDPNNFLYRDEITQGESFIFDNGTIGTLTGPYIDKQENYSFHQASISFNPNYPSGDDAQYYINRLPRLVFSDTVRLPVTDPNGVEIVVADTMYTKTHNTVEDSLRVMHPLMDGYTLTIDETGPTTSSGKLKVDVAFQKTIIVHWTGTIRQDIKPAGRNRINQHQPSQQVTGSLKYAYDPVFTFTPIP